MNDNILHLEHFTQNIPVALIRGSGYAAAVNHAHDFVEITQVLQGIAVNNIDGVDYKISPSDVIMMLPGCSHHIRPKVDENNPTGDNFKILNVLFSPDILPGEYLDEIAGKPVLIRADSEIIALIQTMEFEYMRRQAHFKQLLSDYARMLVGLILRKQINNGENDVAQPNFRETYLIEAADFITEHFTEQISVDEIAQHVLIAKGYLHRIFKQRFGVTIKGYIIRLRIQQSCKYLLETNWSVQKIAEAVGFLDLKHFFNTFKTMLGTTPNSYRQSNKGNG